MIRRNLLALAMLAAMGAATPALAACPPLSVYRVGNVSLNNGTLAQAAVRLFDNTAWKVDTSLAASALTVSMANVSGPLDQVLAQVLKAAGSTDYTVSSTEDTAQCIVRIDAVPVGSAVAAAGSAPPAHAAAATYPVRASAPAAATQQHPGYILPAHQLLSRALGDYVKGQGWTLKWSNAVDDYPLDAPFPIPSGKDVIAGVMYVISAYKRQGAMLGVTPVFAKPNHVVAILPTTAAAQEAHR